MLKSFFDGGIHGHGYGDLNWIIEQIDKLPIGIQNEVEQRYSDIYESLSGEYYQRYRSNTWLRMTVIKYAVKVDKSELMF